MFEEIEATKISRKRIAIRLVFSILFFIVLEILKTILQLATLFQYIYLLVMLDTNRPVQRFTNKLVTYTYQVLRYAGLAGNETPFPLGDFPPEKDPPAEELHFGMPRT